MVLVNHLAQAADKQAAAVLLQVLLVVVEGGVGALAAPLAGAAAVALVAVRVPVAPAVEAGAAVSVAAAAAVVAGTAGGVALAAPAGAAGGRARLLGLAGADLEGAAADGDVEGLEGAVSGGLVGEVDEAVARVAAADGVHGDVNLFKVAEAALVEHLLDCAGLYRVQKVACNSPC